MVARFALAVCSVGLLALLGPPASAIESGSPFRDAIASVQLGDFDKMVERRRIRVLVPYSKMSFFVDGDTLHGIAVDLLRDFEKQLNAKIKDKSKRIFVFMVPTPRDRLLDDLVAGKGDIVAANLTITPERQEKVAFADPLLTGVRELVVTSSSAGDLTKIEDLSGKSITVRRSSSYFDSIEATNAVLKEKGLPPILIKEADPRFEDEDILEMVQAELVPATVVDSHKLELWRKVYMNIKGHEGVPLRDNGQIAWAFRKDSPKLAEVVDRFIAESKKGTERGNILYSEYIKSDNWLKKANSPENVGRLTGLHSLFRKYGEMYNIDPFLMAAIAFQESRFDQKLVMRTGATGIMQMMPATARDPNVDLPNIENLETNVHAFSKYFRFMRQRYVNQEAVSDFDRLMLLLASYNAGPERLKKLRAKATDPNIWHENVEWVVWKSVGLETVQYVRNVHRYYIAFKELAEANAVRRALISEVTGK
jgi:membrane-bound lytic murein transglycosylase MltF